MSSSDRIILIVPRPWLAALLGAIVALAGSAPVLTLAATGETKIGVTAASNIDAIGKPPISPARDLKTGLEVFFHEKVTTNAAGRVQLLFRDGTSLTIGAGSEMVIDEFIFDPASGIGEMAINVTKGVFRLVGGKISKKTPVRFNTPTATVAVRGAVVDLAVQTNGATTAHLVFGDLLKVTSLVTGMSANTTQAGFFIDNSLKVKRRDRTSISEQLNKLEREPKRDDQPKAPESPAAEPAVAAVSSSGANKPPDPETDPNAGKEPAPGEAESVPVENKQALGESPPPGIKDGEVRRPNDLSGSSSGSSTVTFTSSGSSSSSSGGSTSIISSLAGDLRKRMESGRIDLAKFTTEKGGTPQKLNSDTRVGQSMVPGTTLGDDITKIETILDGKGEIVFVTEKDGSSGGSIRIISSSSSGSSFTFGSRAPRRNVATAVYASGGRIGFATTVSGEGARLKLLSSAKPLCIDCRFLDWRRTLVRSSGRGMDSSSIQYWLSGVLATSAELAAAANKTASYSGGLIGGVIKAGSITDKTGQFDARVRFGLRNYQVQAIHAAFDGRDYHGASGQTPNNALFQVTGAADDRTLEARGYFFGTAAPSAGGVPPEMGGQFRITGNDYSAGGVFAGKAN